MKPTHENPTNEDDDQERSCTRKRPFPTLDCVLFYLDYYANLYGKPFGYYRCEKFCGEFHVFSLKLETAPD